MIGRQAAELRPDQRDTNALPPCVILDPIPRADAEGDRDYEGIVSLGFQPEVVRKVVTLVDRSEYKRRQTPLGVKLTVRAFGRDRRLPITNAYRVQHVSLDVAREREAARPTSDHQPSCHWAAPGERARDAASAKQMS